MLWHKPIRKVSFFSLYYLLFSIKKWYERIIHWIWKPKVVISIMDESEKYIEKRTKQFLKKLPEKRNENIDPICYSLDDFQQLIVEENNRLEEEWKRRILVEYTPRGNIIMYYDIFKHAFAYASDQNMPYRILSACAMKYVDMFNCMDFFVDSTILPVDIISPFSLLQNELENKQKEDIEIKKREMGIQFVDAPFAKLKNYSNKAGSVSKNQKAGSKTEEMIDKNPNIGDMIKYSNNFRYLGKISNVSFLLKPKKDHPITSKTSDFVQSFDYHAYKKSLQMKKKEE